MREQFDARDLVHTPAQMMTEFVQWSERIQNEPGVKFGIPAIDKVLIPIRPGNLVSVIARPGHAKTSLLVFLARQEAARILARGKESEECVVYVTWEQTSEELTAMLMARPEANLSDIVWGRADMSKINRMAVKGARNPVWIIGHGISRAGLNVPRMTPSLVLQAIESMQADFNIRPTLMLFDYLQLIPTRRAQDRVQQVTEMPIKIKELAMRIGAPAIAGVQASREVDSQKLKIPEARHAQWASSIEQTSDRILSLWRPALTEDRKTPDGDEIERIDIDGQILEFTENLLIIQMLKQRGDRGRYRWAMYFDPALMKLAELETRKVEF